MNKNKRFIALTTINKPNDILSLIAQGARENQIPFIITGDVKSPSDFHLDGVQYYDIEQQNKAFSTFSNLLPTSHYTRKNIAYLIAIKQGALEIQETDDDNIPYESFWNFDTSLTGVNEISADQSWCNVYRHFTDKNIWPRGFSLQRIMQPTEMSVTKGTTRGLIYQGLANDNPDVDAIYRLSSVLPITFEEKAPVVLKPGFWCPFNSQNTIFKKEAFPLLYLPSYCSFRMTDIWRSFVAIRCLWELGEGVVFHNASVYQRRNEHDLLKDFEDEIPGYLNNEKLTKTLEECRLNSGDMVRNLVICYEALVAQGIISFDELALVKRWCEEIEYLM